MSGLVLDGGQYLPHYGVCRSMAAPSRRYDVVVCPEDVCFQVKPLKLLAARVVATSLHVSKRSCPADLMDLVESQQDEIWLHFEEKQRTCESLVGRIKVGEFTLFKGFEERMIASMFTVDLVKAASNVLRFCFFSLFLSPLSNSHSYTTIDSSFFANLNQPFWIQRV